MASRYVVRGNQNIKEGLTQALQDISDTLGMEVNDATPTWEAEGSEQAMGRQGENITDVTQDRSRWACTIEFQGPVFDEAKFAALAAFSVVVPGETASRYFIVQPGVQNTGKAKGVRMVKLTAKNWIGITAPA